MKKIGFLFLSFVLFVFLTSCSQESKVQEQAKKIEFSVQTDTLQKEKATFLLRNNRKKSITYQEEYWLEQLKEKKWYKMKAKEEVYFNLQAYVLEPGKKREIEINWKDTYGKLKKGTYRLVKKVYVTPTEESYIFSTFQIES